MCTYFAPECKYLGNILWTRWFQNLRRWWGKSSEQRQKSKPLHLWFVYIFLILLIYSKARTDPPVKRAAHSVNKLTAGRVAGKRQECVRFSFCLSTSWQTWVFFLFFSFRLQQERPTMRLGALQKTGVLGETSLLLQAHFGVLLYFLVCVPESEQAEDAVWGQSSKVSEFDKKSNV